MTDKQFKNSACSPTFCILPWIHMATRTSGDVLSCCVGGSLKSNLNHSTFSQTWNGSSIRELRKKMIYGEKSLNCMKCYKEESAGIPSQRIRSNQLWKKHFSYDKLIEKTDGNGLFDGNFVYLDLRLGNKCNLVCNMCGPQEAIGWGSMARKIYKHAKTPQLKKCMEERILSTIYNPIRNWFARPEVIQDIYNNLSHMRSITIAGGEPFLIKEHYDLLNECIRRKVSHQITINYHTNATVLDINLFKKWKQFKRVNLFVSIDDLKDRNYYIRYPCKWEVIEKNLDMIDRESPPNVQSMIMCTVQAMNIFYLPEFLSWISDKGFKKVHSLNFYDSVIHTEVVHGPLFLSCQIIPPLIKDIIVKKYQNVFDKYGKKAERLSSILNFMNQRDESRWLPVFKDYIETLDKIRDTNFSNPFSEYSELLNRELSTHNYFVN